MYESEIARLAEALSAWTRRSPEAREALGALASLLGRITGEREKERERRPARMMEVRRAEGREIDEDAADVVQSVAARERVVDERGGPRPPLSLDVVLDRCRLKAEACRWSIERRRLQDQGVDFDEQIGPRDAELLERARALPDCFVWTLHPYAELPDDDRLETVAGCYEGLAVAAETMKKIDELSGDRDAQQEGMQSIAAAQSALRQALFDAGRRQRDTDQEEAFGWLKQETAARRIYVARHMRLMDPADPSTWQARVESAGRLVERLSADGEHAGAIQRHLNRVRYHAERADAGSAETHDWERIDESVTALVEELGVEPGSTPLCEALELAVDMMPEGFEPGPAFRVAMRACEAWVESFDEEDGEEEWEDGEPTETSEPGEEQLAQ